MKAQTITTFPVFVGDDRKDVAGWVEEFDRLARHTVHGGEVEGEDCCTMIVTACAKGSTAGDRHALMDQSAALLWYGHHCIATSVCGLDERP